MDDEYQLMKTYFLDEKVEFMGEDILKTMIVGDYSLIELRISKE